jgi:hypothetical protein
MGEASGFLRASNGLVASHRRRSALLKARRVRIADCGMGVWRASRPRGQCRQQASSSDGTSSTQQQQRVLRGARKIVRSLWIVPPTIRTSWV